MLTSLGVAGLLGIIGTFAAVLWTAVLGVGGAPGSALAVLGTRSGKRRPHHESGTFVSFLVESYLLLAFAGLVIRFVDGFLATRPAAPAWPLWIVGWYLATAPVLFGGRSTPGAAARDATDTAFAFALPVAAFASGDQRPQRDDGGPADRVVEHLVESAVRARADVDRRVAPHPACPDARLAAAVNQPPPGTPVRCRTRSALPGADALRVGEQHLRADAAAGRQQSSSSADQRRDQRLHALGRDALGEVVQHLAQGRVFSWVRTAPRPAAGPPR